MTGIWYVYVESEDGGYRADVDAEGRISNMRRGVAVEGIQLPYIISRLYGKIGSGEKIIIECELEE